MHLTMFAIILNVLKLEVLEYLVFHNNEDVFLHQLLISFFISFHFLVWAFGFCFVLDVLIHNFHQNICNFVIILFLFVPLVYYLPIFRILTHFL